MFENLRQQTTSDHKAFVNTTNYAKPKEITLEEITAPKKDFRPKLDGPWTQPYSNFERGNRGVNFRGNFGLRPHFSGNYRGLYNSTYPNRGSYNSFSQGRGFMRGNLNQRGTGNFTQPRGNFQNNRGRDGNNRPQGAYCYYHSKFGSQATNCSEPCRFKTVIDAASTESKKHAPRGSNNNAPPAIDIESKN